MDVVLGTAGHIDHGKTSLVRALTGINCDRLEEEQRRGITIELGFAWLDLPDGRRLGIVDVPGHERFVKAMVAGAAGIDCVLLIVAADEGVMPQTREHLDICQFLGVRSGIVVLTKTDLVDADWLEMVTEDVREAVAETFLKDAPILRVSSTTGEGIVELEKAIVRMVSVVEPKTGTDIFRLPVDRVFTMKGYGTIVTGTMVSGSCAQGDEVRIMPDNISAKARTLQVHGAQVGIAGRGMRCAINLQGVDVSVIQRGNVIAHPGMLFPSRRWVVQLDCLASAPRPIKQRMEAHFHHGSSESSARIVFRDREELGRGQSAIAEIHFPRPMTGIFGDHFVLRANAPLRAIAGGILLDPLPSLLRKRDKLFALKMEAYSKLAGLASPVNCENGLELLKTALFLRPAPGVDVKLLAVCCGLSQDRLQEYLEEGVEAGDIICWDKASNSYIGKDAFRDCIENCCNRARELHEREPLKTFFSANALVSGWGNDLPEKFTAKVLDAAEKTGLLQQSGNGFKLASHKVTHDAAQSALLQTLLRTFKDGGATPPFFKDVQSQLGYDAKLLQRLVNYLCETGELMKVQEGVYYYKPELDKVLKRVEEWFQSHETLDIGDMKTILDISRKYAIPLLEYMDAMRITMRVGNSRKKGSGGVSRKD